MLGGFGANFNQVQLSLIHGSPNCLFLFDTPFHIEKFVRFLELGDTSCWPLFVEKMDKLSGIIPLLFTPVMTKQFVLEIMF